MNVAGANLSLTADEAVSIWGMLGGARLLLLQSEIPESVSLAVARAARETGTRILLHASPIRPIEDALLGLTDALLVNRFEAALLAGFAISEPAGAMRAAEALARRCPPVLITLGSDGFVMVEVGRPPVYRPALERGVATAAEEYAFAGASPRPWRGAGLPPKPCASCWPMRRSPVPGRGFHVLKPKSA